VLNGTYQGAATGETFVKEGKTDILVRIEDRHVFVGECKWWDGPKACAEAVDQLLRYLPWRDEKGALVVFITLLPVSHWHVRDSGVNASHASRRSTTSC
jgi:hypothetical protein